MKYRMKKCVEGLQANKKYVEAIQFTRNNFDEVVKFTNNRASNLNIEATCDLVVLNDINSTVHEYDYIVKCDDGILMRIDSEDFEKIYELQCND